MVSQRTASGPILLANDSRISWPAPGIPVVLIRSTLCVMKRQSYSNHRRFVWWFHYLLLALCVLFFLGTSVYLYRVVRHAAGDLLLASLMSLLSVVLLLFYYTLRKFPLGVQDRIIRAEENFRHYQLTGQHLDHRLHLRQIIALRFAPDDEFVNLCKEAIERELSETEIKKKIRRWRGDYHRI